MAIFVPTFTASGSVDGSFWQILLQKSAMEASAVFAASFCSGLLRPLYLAAGSLTCDLSDRSRCGCDLDGD
jgi:hypothetical protein